MTDDECVAAWNALAENFKKSGRFDQAEQVYLQVLKLTPDNVGAMNDVGLTYEGRDMRHEAVAWFARAVQASNCISPIELSNLALQLWWIRRFDEALLAAEKSIELGPELSCTNAIMGMLMLDLQQPERALEYTEKAIAIDPKAINLIWNRALDHLMLGNYEQGWQDFEIRYSPDNGCRCSLLPDLPIPVWQGESLAGKKLLVYKDQGFGDQIQCLRWLPHLLEMCDDVTVWVEPALVDIVKSVAPVKVVTSELDIVFDYVVMTYSLPLRFGANEATIPREPYIHADPLRSAVVGAVVDNFAQGRPKVGITYFGGAIALNDCYRSAKLKDVLPLVENPDIAWVSLHNEAKDTHPNMLYMGDYINTFADTAAIIAGLDLVITIDSGNAHLASAMGKPVWMMISTNNDYRWLVEREDTPWYLTMKLFRQTKLGNWGPVVERISDLLLEWTSAISSRV